MVAPGLFSSPSKIWKKGVVAFCISLVVALACLCSTRVAIITGASWQRLTAQFPMTVSQSSGPLAQVGWAETEVVEEIPFWVWVVLPRLFPEKLPGAGGYRSLGLTWEPGNQLPIGFIREEGGVPRVVFSDPSSANFDIQGYTQFLVDCARDPRFNPNFILPEIRYNVNLSAWEKLVYRVSVIPNTKKMLLARATNIGK